MAIRPFDDERMAINMSVWESLEALQQFVYQSAHIAPASRSEAVVRADGGPDSRVVVGPRRVTSRPSLEAKERLEHLKVHGPTAHAFTFRVPFPAPDGEPGDVAGLDAAFCEWAT